MDLLTTKQHRNSSPSAQDITTEAARCAAGEGCPKDLERAFTLYREAARLGGVEAQFRLGVAYAHGYGTGKDYVESIRWLRMAADAGHSGAQDSMGVRYMTGEGVRRNEEEAFAWFYKAAMQGNPVAQFNLGLTYVHGQGTRLDYAEAFVWCSLSAEQGDAMALESCDRLAEALSPAELAKARKKILSTRLEIRASQALQRHPPGSATALFVRPSP